MFEEIKQILVTSFQAEPDEVTAESSLQDLGLDSLDMVELSMVLKSELGLVVSDDELIELQRVGPLVQELELRGARL